MKLAPFVLCLAMLCVGVVAQRASASPTTPTTTTTTTTTTTPTTPTIDPIVADYMQRARELYVKALIEYYHAHPERLRPDLSMLTTSQYEVMVPAEILTEFNINRDEIDQQLRENDQDILQTAQTETDDQTETSAVPATDADTNADATEATTRDRDFYINQFGRWGFGRGWGRGFGWGGGFGFPFWGGGFGWGRGFGWGFPGFGFGFGGPWGGFGWI